MLGLIAKKIFGTRNDRVLKSLAPSVTAINALEQELKKLTNQQLTAKSAVFKERISRGESLDSILPEAFATVREASVRTLGMRHFDVQLIGGMVLHRGMISEMKTGEGKTLVATLAAYLNALQGKGVHIVTVNDYLAKRDAEWMAHIYNFLGLSVGVVHPGLKDAEKRAAYAADITYGQNNEFGFDYLRDNMKFSVEDQFQRGHHYAIVDEVDSILIDEARTPLIISGPAEDSTELYFTVNKIIPALQKEKDYTVELRTRRPTLSEEGIAKTEQLLGIDNLYAPQHIDLVHHVQNALTAHTCFERDVDYIVKDGQVVIVDEFTGRLMAGRRWSNGLHQAVEAKEGLKVARENQTLASITFQNLFRMYSKLAGMTGTADTEAVEFKQIYNLEVIAIPPNRLMIRDDQSDRVFRTRREKYEAVAQDIIEIHKSGEPILVGTISIEQSEMLSKILTAKGVSHNVLNAKQHEREAEIVAQAGRRGSVTISTNMAGRGTDIVLGGNPDFMAAAKVGTRNRQDPNYQAALEEFKVVCNAEREEVLKAGGLFIMGTERHESRRIDNQLRGRAGRQGDPGKSRFYVSLEDDLMVRFGGDRMQNIMKRLGWEEGLAIDGRLISRSIESAQKRVEGFHFEQRKHVTEYDDVMNKQRQVVYNLRTKILTNQGVRDEILEMAADLVEEAVVTRCDESTKAMEWDLNALLERFNFLFNKQFTLPQTVELKQQVIFDALWHAARDHYVGRASDLDARLKVLAQVQGEVLGPLADEFGDGVPNFDFGSVERETFLSALDHFWNIHLQEMDHLREGIGLRSYAQKNPLHEYQREGFLQFQETINSVKETVIRRLCYYAVPSPEELRAHLEREKARREEVERRLRMVHESSLGDAPSTDPGAAHKSPEAERARLLAQKKARRKLRE
ncbi:MAG: preprotein translocase subunit SecA [Oligoflexia bacterium]|nr:preprotein translocase subunit SecA [Oligoflexia bacterium]